MPKKSKEIKALQDSLKDLTVRGRKIEEKVHRLEADVSMLKRPWL